MWQIVTKEKRISVAKEVLGDRDLGDYLSEELGEVIDNEIVFLKEVQEIQRTKVLAEAMTKKDRTKIPATDYSTLIGKVLDVSNERFEVLKL